MWCFCPLVNTFIIPVLYYLIFLWGRTGVFVFRVSKKEKKMRNEDFAFALQTTRPRVARMTTQDGHLHVSSNRC